MKGEGKQLVLLFDIRDRDLVELHKDLFGMAGASVFSTSSTRVAQRFFNVFHDRIKLILLNPHYNRSAYELITWLKQRGADTELVAYSADTFAVNESLRVGCRKALEMPCDPEELISLLQGPNKGMAAG